MSEEMRGRANSMYRMLAQSAEPLGLTTAGVALAVIGPRAYALVAAGLFLVVVLTTHLKPSARQRA